MNISQIMTTPILSIDENETAMQAAKVMADHQVTSVLVRTDTTYTGILTQDDILTSQTIRLKDVKVKDFKITPVLKVMGNLTCKDAIRLMIIQGYRKLIVTKDEQNIGLFTLTNILNNLPSTS